MDPDDQNQTQTKSQDSNKTGSDDSGQNKTQSSSTNDAKDFSVGDFIEKDILTLMGAESMSDEEKVELYNKMLETIKSRVIIRVLDSLSEEEYANVKKALSDEDEEKFAQLVLDSGMDLSKIYSEEALLYKMEMVNLMQMANSKKEA